MLGLIALIVSVAAWLAAPAQAFAGPTVTKQIEQAETQLRIALKLAEQSLAPHQVGSGWTRTYMQQVINVLQGEQGTDFNAKVENPRDGHGAVNYLKSAHEALHDKVDPKLIEALSSTSAYVVEAIEHAKRSIKGANVAEVHGHARLAAGMLSAALGSPDSVSPVTGALQYAKGAPERTSTVTK